LAKVMMSGTTPYFSAPVQVPSRPKPVMTSSVASSTPWRSQISRSALEVALGRGEAAAGVLHRLDDHEADGLGAGLEDEVLDRAGRVVVLRPVGVGVRRVEVDRAQRLERLAQAREAGHAERPEGGAVVGVVAADDLDPLGSPFSRWYCWASLMADSTASEPELTKKNVVEVAGEALGERVRRGRSPAGGVGPVGRERQLAHLLAAASTISWRP
jgi:hypothetical protein